MSVVNLHDGDLAIPIDPDQNEIVYLPAGSWVSKVTHLRKVGDEAGLYRMVSEPQEAAFKRAWYAKGAADIGLWVLSGLAVVLGTTAAVTGWIGGKELVSSNTTQVGGRLVEVSTVTTGIVTIVTVVGAGILTHVASNTKNTAQQALDQAEKTYEDLAGALLRMSFEETEEARAVCVEAQQLDLVAITQVARKYLSEGDANDMLDPLRQAVDYLNDPTSKPSRLGLASIIESGRRHAADRAAIVTLLGRVESLEHQLGDLEK